MDASHSTSRPIRIGIVGANIARGWALEAHLPAIRSVPAFTVTAVAARSQGLADEAASLFGAKRGYGRAEDLIHDTDVDVVVVTVRVQEHHAIVLSALAAGKHIYCEWPLGANLQEAQELAAAVKPGQLAVVGAQGLSAPAIRQAIDLVQGGAIGRPKVLRVYNTAAAWGPEVAARGYLQDKASGATLATIGMGHVLPAIEALIGPYLQVDARCSILTKQVRVKATGEFVERTCEDHILALGSHDSGCVSTLEVIGGRSDRTALLELVGEDGVLSISGTVAGSYQIAQLRLDASFSIDPFPAPVAPHLSGPPANLAEVYARLATDIPLGTTTLPSFTDALRITKLIDAIDKASSSGVRQFLG